MGIRALTFDRPKPAKNKFKASTNAEREFYRSLRKVARMSGHIVEAYTEGASITDLKKMTEALDNYSKQITPWATRQAAKMLKQVSKSNKRAYERQSKTMGKEIKSSLARTDSLDVGMALLHEQVGLIQSIPLEAGFRAQRIAADNFLNGQRAVPDQSVIDYLTDEMGKSTEVAVNRAKLIARTETAQANAAFVQARAQAVGVTHYIWRTTMDGAERKSHREMNGKVIDYAKPPRLSDGMIGHAGQFPNCRCFQDPVLPEAEE